MDDMGYVWLDIEFFAILLAKPPYAFISFRWFDIWPTQLFGWHQIRRCALDGPIHISWDNCPHLDDYTSTACNCSQLSIPT
jgi:hypothetical protein